MARRPLPKGRVARLEIRYVVPGLQRGLSILELFGREHPSLSLSEIARRLKLSRSTVFRLLYTLESAGYLAKTRDTGEYTLTPKALSLGLNYLNQLPLPQIAHSVLRALAEEAQAATHLVVLDGHEAVHIARFTPGALIVSNLQVGTRRLAHAVPSGRVLLSHKSEEDLIHFYRRIKKDGPIANLPTLEAFLATARADRDRGYAYGRTVREPDLMSCASAVLDHASAPVAAVAVIGPRTRLDSVLGEVVIAKMVVKAAKLLSSKLGYGDTRVASLSAR